MADPSSDASPAATDEEVAAIAAATEALWPRAVVTTGISDRNTAWRFSGRWWAKPVSARRDRPFR